MNLKDYSERCNALLSIHTPLIWVVTREEKVAEKAIVKEAMRLKAATHFYYCDTTGGHMMDPLTLLPSTAQTADDIDDMFEQEAEAFPAEVRGLAEALGLVAGAPESTMLVIRDADDVFRNPACQRAIFNVCMRDAHKEGIYHPLVMITTQSSVPPMLQDFTTSIELPLQDERENLLMIARWAKAHNAALTKEQAFRAARSATGLTITQVQHAMADSLHTGGRIEPASINDVRVQIIKQSSVLRYVEPKKTLDTIGGHEELKKWIREGVACQTQEARAQGVESSKGYISVGFAGTGKTAIAEAIAHEMHEPLIIFDISAIMGGLVGQSEQQARHAFDTIRSVGRCVVLLDEVDKALAGVNSGASVSDGGTIQRVFQILLDQMQYNNGEQFFILTANRIDQLRTELMRTGRLDRKWLFGFPSKKEREGIFRIYFKKKHRDVPGKLVDYAARIADHFTGAEIEAAVNNMIRISFLSGQPIDESTVYRGIREISSIYETNREDVQSLMQFARKHNIRETSSGEITGALGKEADLMDARAKARFEAQAEAFEALSKGA